MRKACFNNTGLWFILFVVLALALRLIYLNQTAQFIQPGPGSDADFYLRWAKEIAGGDILGHQVFDALPAYPYFLSLAYLASGGAMFGLFFIQLLIGAVNCGLIYLAGKQLFNQQVGILAAVIACGYALFIFYDRMLLPATLSGCLGLALLLLVLKAKQRPGVGIWLSAGLLLGLSTLSSASFALIALFILCWLIYEYRHKQFRRVGLYCLSLIMPFCLVVGATSLRNYLVAEDAVLVTAHSGINFYIGNNPQANGLFKAPALMRPTQSGLIEDARIVAGKLSNRALKPSEASRFWLRRALDFMANNPLGYLRLLGRKLALFWNGKEQIDDLEYYLFNQQAKLFKLPLFRFSLIAPFALLGIVFSWPERKRVILLYLFVFALMLSVVSFFINARYRLIAVPYLILFASAAVWQIWQRFNKRQYTATVTLLILVAGLYCLTNLKLADADSALAFTSHYNKGIYLADQKEYPNAEKEFLAALKINRQDFMSYFGLANLYYQMQDFNRAVENFKQVLALNPYFYNANFNLGITYKRLGESERAQAQFLRVLELKPDDLAARYNLGKIYQAQGLNQKALQEYQAALAIDPARDEIIQAIREIKR